MAQFIKPDCCCVRGDDKAIPEGSSLKANYQLGKSLDGQGTADVKRGYTPGGKIDASSDGNTW